MLTTRTYRIVGGVAVACAALATGAPTASADAPVPWTVTSPTPPTPSPRPAADPWQAAANRSAANHSAAWTTTDLREATARSAKVGAAAGATATKHATSHQASVHRSTRQHTVQRKAMKRAAHRRAAVQLRVQQQPSHAHRAAPSHAGQHAAAPLHRIGTWTVHEGQSLSLIAALNATTVHRLVNANADRYPSLRANPDHIETDWSLHIPAAQR